MNVQATGQAILVEGKTTAELENREIAQIALAAQHIRPNVILIACLEEVTEPLRKAVERLKSKLAPGITAEILALDARWLDDSPFLPD